MNDARNAEKAYRKSIELNSNNPEALINLTILEIKQGKFKEAKQSFYSFQEACLSSGAIDKEIFELGRQVSDILDEHNESIDENDGETPNREETTAE